MGKISIANKKGKFTITNKLSYPETVNERVCNDIASGVFEGFIPVFVRQKRKETIVECTVQGLITLDQYFSEAVTKSMFLDIVYEIVLLVKSCDKNMINANNLDLQNDMIFVDPQTQSVKCIFWPVVNNRRETPPHMFFRQLPVGLSFDQYEDNSYLEEYNSFFDVINPFSVNNFEKLILKLSGKQITDSHLTPSGMLSSAYSEISKPQIKNANTVNNSNIEYDPFADNNQQMYT